MNTIIYKCLLINVNTFKKKKMVEYITDNRQFASHDSDDSDEE